MRKEIRKLYVVRVDDLKPISGECLGETLDANEIVYLIERDVENIIIRDVCVGVDPQTYQCAEYNRNSQTLSNVCNAA